MVVSSFFSILPPIVFGRIPIRISFRWVEKLKPEIREHTILTAFTEKQNIPYVYIHTLELPTYTLKGPESLFVSKTNAAR